MQQIVGGWRLGELRNGAARLVLKSATGSEVYMDLSPDDLGGMRARLDAIAPVGKAKAAAAEPDLDKTETSVRASRRRA